MFRPSISMTRLLWVVAIALLAVRMTDAHVHLCLDGQEPPRAVHLEDHAGRHDVQHAGQTHNDIDVSVLGTALIKKSDVVGGPDVTPALAAVLIAVLISAQLIRVFLLEERRLPRLPLPAFFLPPSHAPPR